MPSIFLLTPLREGRQLAALQVHYISGISTHAPAGGATSPHCRGRSAPWYFYSRPCGRGDMILLSRPRRITYFYSRPCGRGDPSLDGRRIVFDEISTHAPAGGATREDMVKVGMGTAISTHAPAGGATISVVAIVPSFIRFLLTPLREGRPNASLLTLGIFQISTHAPAGGATQVQLYGFCRLAFLLTPLREGRRACRTAKRCIPHFYSRPCGRGDGKVYFVYLTENQHFYSRPCGRGDEVVIGMDFNPDQISTHAPAGGATQPQTG